MSRILITVFTFTLYCSSSAAILVNNSKKAIDACKGNLDLRLLRIWGGPDEQDENRYFTTPISMAIDSNNTLYICDMHNHCLKVFGSTGEYLRTIGRRGQGPGDLMGPGKVTIAPNGDIVVFESGGFRLQRFNPEGKSKRIIIIPRAPGWIGITSKNEIALYSWLTTFLSKRIISFMDETGKTIREIGYHDDHANNYIDSEKLDIAMDDSDRLYVANMWTPVIRRYTSDGELQIAVTFESPLSINTQIKLNPTETEIEISRPDEGSLSYAKKDTQGNVLVDKRGKPRPIIVHGIAVDEKSRIYVVTPRRALTESENQATRVSGSIDGISRKLVDFNITENINIDRLLVFNGNGEICGEAPIRGMCDDIYIHKNRLFIIDAYINQRILEYEIIIKDDNLKKS